MDFGGKYILGIYFVLNVGFRCVAPQKNLFFNDVSFDYHCCGVERMWEAWKKPCARLATAPEKSEQLIVFQNATRIAERICSCERICWEGRLVAAHGDEMPSNASRRADDRTSSASFKFDRRANPPAETKKKSCPIRKRIPRTLGRPSNQPRSLTF